MDHEELIIPSFQRVLDEIDAEIEQARAKAGKDTRTIAAWPDSLKSRGRWTGAWLYKAYYDIIRSERKRFEGSKALRNYIVELGARGERYWLAERNKAAAE